jgi:hypothetical protein
MNIKYGSSIETNGVYAEILSGNTCVVAGLVDIPSISGSSSIINSSTHGGLNIITTNTSAQPITSINISAATNSIGLYHKTCITQESDTAVDVLSLINTSAASNTTKCIALLFNGTTSGGTTKPVNRLVSIPEDINYCCSSLGFEVNFNDTPTQRMTLNSVGKLDVPSNSGSGGFISSGNYGSTGCAAFFPNGLYTVGNNWLFGNVCTCCSFISTNNCWCINDSGRAKFCGGIVGKTTVSCRSDCLCYTDSRNDDFSGFTPYVGVTYHIKENTTDGLNDGGTYHGTMHLTHWGDDSGGNAHQLAFTDNNNLWIRGFDTTTWSSWKCFIDSDNIGSQTVNDSCCLGGLEASCYALGSVVNPTGLTENYVTKWDSSKFVNSTIYDDGACVGIGLTGTTALLSIKGIGTDKTTNSFNIVDNSGNAVLYVNDAGNVIIGKDVPLGCCVTGNATEPLQVCGDMAVTGGINFIYELNPIKHACITTSGYKMTISPKGIIGGGGYNDTIFIDGHCYMQSVTSAPSKFLNIAGIIAQTGSSSYSALYMDVCEISTGNGTTRLVDFRKNTNPLFIVDNQGCVGIGSSSPDRNIDITDTVPAIRLTPSTGGYWEIGNGIAGVDRLTFHGSAAPCAMVIRSNGNVGIGATSPEGDLQIGNATTPICMLLNGMNNCTGSTVVRFGDGSINPNYSMQMRFDTSNNKLHIEGDNDGDGVFENKFTITRSGYVGVGTSYPDSKLHVVGSEIKLEEKGVRSFSVAETGSASYLIKTVCGVMRLSAGATRMTFEINEDERMRITDDGKVGIGTQTPATLLNLSGGTTIAENGLTWGDGTMGFYQPTPDNLYFDLGGTNRLRISSSGVIFGSSGSFPFIYNTVSSSVCPVIIPRYNDIDTGLGWAATDQLALIAGGRQGLRIDSSTDTGYTRTWLNPDGSVGKNTGLWFGDGDTGIYESSDDNIWININSTVKAIINSSRIGSANGRGGGLLTTNASATQPTLIPWIGEDPSTGIGSPDYRMLSLIAGGVEGIRVCESASTITTSIGGKVYIGDTTTTPSYELDVYGTINTGGLNCNGRLLLNWGCDGNGGGFIDIANDTSVIIGKLRSRGGLLYIGNTCALAFMSEGTNVFHITNTSYGENGLVGLSNTDPKARLHSTATYTASADNLNQAIFDGTLTGYVNSGSYGGVLICPTFESGTFTTQNATPLVVDAMWCTTSGGTWSNNYLAKFKNCGDTKVYIRNTGGIVIPAGQGFGSDLTGNGYNSMFPASNALHRGISFTGVPFCGYDAAQTAFNFDGKSFDAVGGSQEHKGLNLNYCLDFSQAQTGTMTGIYLDAIETQLNGITHNLMNLTVSGDSKFLVDNSGNITTSGNITATGNICTSGCFVGSGAGLTGTATNLTVGCASNSACLGGQLPSYYATATHIHGCINNTGCMSGGASGCVLCTTSNGCITYTTTVASATNASCLGGQLPSYYACSSQINAGNLTNDSIVKWCTDKLCNTNISDNGSMVTVNSPLTVTGNTSFCCCVTIFGDLNVSGTTTTVNTCQLTTEDNIICINYGETGGGVSSGCAGIQVDRGTCTDYQFMFVESDNTFKVGEIGELQSVATRGTLSNKYIPMWSGASSTFCNSIVSQPTDTSICVAGCGNFACDTTFGGNLISSVGNGLYFDGGTAERIYSPSDDQIWITTSLSTLKFNAVDCSLILNNAGMWNQENLDVDTGQEVVATICSDDYGAAFFDFLIKNGTNLRAGTVYAVHDGTNVEYTETSTQQLGDTADVVLSVDLNSCSIRLLADVTSDNWCVKSLVRGL